MKFSLSNIRGVLNENKISKFRLTDDGKLIVKTTSKKKLNALAEKFEREYVKENSSEYSFQLQNVLDIFKIVEECRNLGIDVSANKNIMYISGKGASKEVAMAIAEKYGGEYTEQLNPFLKKGFYRINFYDENGLFLFNPVKIDKLNNKF